MADQATPGTNPAAEAVAKTEHGGKATKDEIALDLMKFVAVTTGYGKGPSATGFGGKASRSPEEYAESLLQLFERCREVVNKG